MKNLFLWLSVSFVVFFAFMPAYAGSAWVTSETLYKACQSEDETPFCAGYIIGIGDMLNAVEGQARIFCPPDELTSTEIFGAVAKFIAERPELQGFNASIVVAAALAKTYPCNPTSTF